MLVGFVKQSQVSFLNNVSISELHEDYMCKMNVIFGGLFKMPIDRHKLIEDFKLAEEIAVNWLKDKGYRILYWHERRASNKPYDILAEKGNLRWIIDVKSGKDPSINLENFAKLLEIKNIEIPEENRTFTPNRIGYIFIVDGEPFLLEYNRYK